jgi:hypothetical protein
LVFTRILTSTLLNRLISITSESDFELKAVMEDFVMVDHPPWRGQGEKKDVRASSIDEEHPHPPPSPHHPAPAPGWKPTFWHPYPVDKKYVDAPKPWLRPEQLKMSFIGQSILSSESSAKACL